MAQRFRLDHLAVHVSDMDRAVHFYTTILGLVEVANPMGAGFVTWLALDERVTLHLVPGGGAPPPSRTIQTHMALAVGDFDETIARLTDAGATFGELPRRPGKISTRPDGVRQAFVRDPDGYWIEINDAPAR
jgi:catechol 2,3-dioxygenase-like lactoylglutathione lyase family enzyme